jgi:DNA-binding transcriptional MerR regulator
MSPAPEGTADSAQLFRIGEAAERAGVSSRTLRWYEEIGLLAPSGHSSGGARRYSQDDLTRIEHIRELQSLLGLDLGAIRDVLVGEDALAGLRREYQQGVEAARRREILVEASAINEKLRAVVTDRQELLRTMMDSLEEKSARYAMLLAELDGTPGSGRGRVGKTEERRSAGRKVAASGRGRKTASR